MSTFNAHAQKLDERGASLNEMVFADARYREAWEKVMTPDMIFSEDSGTDDGEEVLVVRPLPWRSARGSYMFQEVDRQNLKDKSPQSRRQMKRRVLGENSDWPQCTSELPQWAFCA